MKMFQRMIFLSCLFLSICLITSCGGDNDDGSSQVQAEKAQLTDLLLAFSTRNDITAPNVQDAMVPVAEAAGVAFRDALQDQTLRSQFISDLDPALQTYHQEYDAAPAGVDGVEDRVNAIHHFLSSFMSAAEDAGITSGELSLALVAAFTALEQKLPFEPTNSVLTPEDRELIDLLLLSILNQVELRKYPNGVLARFETLGTDPMYADLVIQNQWTDLYEESALKAALRSCENALSDPAVLADSDALVSHQFNQLAIRDLTFIRTIMEFNFLPQSLDLKPLVSRINSVGGIMADLTEEQLLQSGALSSNGLLGYAVCDWIRPDMPLSYQPVPGLTDELTQLGGTVPDAPNFSLFADPYLAVFQMQYDLMLYNLIATEKRRQAEDELFNLSGQPLPMTERYSWRQVNEAYKQNVVNQFSGASDAEEKAVLFLLTYFWMYY